MKRNLHIRNFRIRYLPICAKEEWNLWEPPLFIPICRQLELLIHMMKIAFCIKTRKLSAGHNVSNTWNYGISRSVSCSGSVIRAMLPVNFALKKLDFFGGSSLNGDFCFCNKMTCSRGDSFSHLQCPDTCLIWCQHSKRRRLFSRENEFVFGWNRIRTLHSIA